MSYCPGSNRPPEHSRRDIKKIDSHVKRPVGIANENQLRRIVNEEFNLDYDKLKNDYIKGRKIKINRFCKNLYANGMGSVSILFENGIATLMYMDGRIQRFSISSNLPS